MVHSADTYVQALASMRAHHYRSIALRDARALNMHRWIDAQIVTAFSLEDPVSRLTAFSRHSRPA